MNEPIYFVAAPMLIAIISLFWREPSTTRRLFGVLSAAFITLGALYFVITLSLNEQRLILNVGDWKAPLGITLVLDPLAAIMLFLSGFSALASLLYSMFELPTRSEHPLRQPLLFFLLTGINLSFVTGDLFNLFVAFEIMLISSYALLTLEANDWDIKQSFPYLTINLLGSTLFLAACGLAYSIYGSLNFAHMASQTTALAGDSRLLVLATLLMCVFSIKAGIFPFYYWLPNSYPILPTPLAAFFAGMLTKVGIYVLFRLFTTVLPHDLTSLHTLLAWLAGATMIFGVLGAVSRNFIRGILSFHILSQIGYMALAIAFFTPLSLAACVFYIIHHIIVKATLFLVGGTVSSLNGTDDLSRTGGLWKVAPILGLCFLLQALSLAGIPPLSGFWGKYLIFVEGIRLHDYLLVAAALLAGILTLYSMLKIWLGAFWSPLPDSGELHLHETRWKPLTAVVAAMTIVSLAIGLGAEHVYRISAVASRMALDQSGYVAAVMAALGKGGF
ncbi:MAG: proton-conducting transporter membrane subunit [Blastochloris sp.]|nr:proton-conducting transporter membrane subunit [Blastochloris sp.]